MKHKLIQLSMFTLLLVLANGCTKDSNESLELNDVEIETLFNEENLEEMDLEGSEITFGEEKKYGYTRRRAIPSFTTLTQALICTGLKDAVKSGYKTIYAPTDKAFAKLGLDKRNICESLDIETLSSILTYHVADRRIPLAERGCIEMLNGDVAHINVGLNGLSVNEAEIQGAYLYRGRNFYHSLYPIGDVLMPPSKTIVETAMEVSDFSSLVAAVLAADPSVAAALSDEDNIFTVFAPTNEAFQNLITALGAADLNDLVATVGTDALTTILLYHVVDGCAYSNDLRDGKSLTTLQGEDIMIDLRKLSILDKTDDPAALVPEGINITASNGIVHTVGKVLLPDAILQTL